MIDLRPILQPVQIVLLVAYTLGLSVWSGIIMLGSGGHWVAGAVPVLGWFYTLAKFDLWSSGFSQMAVLWLVCLGAVLLLRGERLQS